MLSPLSLCLLILHSIISPYHSLSVPLPHPPIDLTPVLLAPQELLQVDFLPVRLGSIPETTLRLHEIADGFSVDFPLFKFLVVWAQCFSVLSEEVVVGDEDGVVVRF